MHENASKVMFSHNFDTPGIIQIGNNLSQRMQCDLTDVLFISNLAKIAIVFYLTFFIIHLYNATIVFIVVSSYGISFCAKEGENVFVLFS